MVLIYHVCKKKCLINDNYQRFDHHCCCCLVIKSCSTLLWPDRLRHTRLLCPPLSPRVSSNSWPLSQWCHPTMSSSAARYFFCLQSFTASGFFQWAGSSHQVAKVLELQLQHQFFQWIFRVDSFRIDWFDLLVVQGALKSLLQHYNLKASVLQCSAFFMVQLSHPYMTAQNNMVLTIQNFVSKVMSQI